MSYNYGNHLPPIHQYYVSGDAIAIGTHASDPATPATQITESGVYIIDSGQNAGTFKISDSDITTNVFIGHGVTMLAKRWIYMYIKAGQYIRASDEGFLAIPLSPA